MFFSGKISFLLIISSYSHNIVNVMACYEIYFFCISKNCPNLDIFMIIFTLKFYVACYCCTILENAFKFICEPLAWHKFVEVKANIQDCRATEWNIELSTHPRIITKECQLGLALYSYPNHRNKVNQIIFHILRLNGDIRCLA